MVTKTIVSRFVGDPPSDEAACRKIADGPLYPVDEVMALLAKSDARTVRVWTNKCQRDVQTLSLDTVGLCKLMEIAVQSGRFRGAQWCVQRPNGPWAACDAYSLVHREWIDTANRYMDITYYIKFAIAKTGNLLLVASCHQ